MLSLDSIPPEIMAEVAQYLDPASHATLRYLSRAMLALIGRAPIMSRTQYAKLNKQFEGQFRRKEYPELEMLCVGCMELLSRDKFQDSKSKNKCLGRRLCIDCSALRGHYEKASFMHKDVRSFWCAGCHEALSSNKEGSYVQERKAEKTKALAQGIKAKKIDTGGQRWCRACWTAIKAWESCHGPRAPQFLVTRYGLDRGLRYNIHGVQIP